MKLTGLLR